MTIARLKTIRSSPARRLLDKVLERAGIPVPDGRALYRYRMSSDEYLRARDILLTAGATLCATNHNACALMVLYASEWFRREATSIWRQWDHLGFLPSDTNVTERSEMVQAGLDYWGVECRLGERGGSTTREFLLTLALNGGIPARLLLGENRHKVHQYFQSVMEEALSHRAACETDITVVARNCAIILPETYRDPAIFELTTDLVGELLLCRNQLPKGKRLEDPAAVLDSLDPDWRERLPIHLPEDTAACSRLFNDLLSIQPQVSAGTVGVRRVLKNEVGKRWVQGFLVEADGLLQAESLTCYDEGRFSAFFSGSASRLVSREFARLYVSHSEDRQAARVEARSLGNPGVIAPVPFDEPITAQILRKGEAPLAFRWPGGERWSASVYVLKPTDSEGLLEVIGTGSTRYSGEVLFVLTTRDATVSAREGGDVRLDWHDAERALWRISGGASVQTDDNERFLVQTGQERSEGRLVLPEVFIPGLIFADSTMVPCEAPVRPLLMDANGVTRPIKVGLEWRQGGQVVDDPIDIRGIAILRWRDEQGFIIDRQRLFVVPPSFRIVGRLVSDGGLIEWQGLQGWNVSALQEDGSRIGHAGGSDENLHITWQDSPRGRQLLRLCDPAGRTADLSIDLEGDSLILVDADGKIRRDIPDLSLPAMRGMTIRSGRLETIDMELRGGGVAAIVMRELEGVVPMTSLHDLAAMLLGLSQHRGPQVVVRDGTGNDICRIRRPQEQPRVNGKVVLFNAQKDVAAVAVARPLTEPDTEHALEQTGQIGAYRLPESINGPCLTYLRSGDAVITSPVLVNGGSFTAAELEALSLLDRCALICNEKERIAGFKSAFDDIADDPAAGAAVALLGRTVVSLRGLSPRALDWTFSLLDCPTLLCRILLSAEEQEIDTVLSLQRDLPFLWMAQPVEAWRRAIVAELDRSVLEISTFLGSLKDAQREGAADIVRRLDAIAKRANWFSAVKKRAGFAIEKTETLDNLAQTHVRNHADLANPLPTQWVNEASKHGIPPAIGKLNYLRHTILVAPILLANVALGRIQMTPRLQAALRSALDADERFVSAAFPYCMEYQPQ